VVVFAAAIEPGDPPDVAVGLALAAHMAKADSQGVSPPRVKTVRKRAHMPGKNYDRPKSEPTPARAALLANLSPDQIITVWLHSKRKITGKVISYDDTMTVLQLVCGSKISNWLALTFALLA
jgi:hypothetical protein